MGVISYSLYLVQETVYSTIPEIKNLPVMTMFFWISIIISISLITYNYIEKPFLTIGNIIKNRF